MSTDFKWQDLFFSGDKEGEARWRDISERFARTVVAALANGSSGKIVEHTSLEKLEQELHCEPSSEGRSIKDVLEEFSSAIIGRSVSLGHPRYMGHMDPQPLAVAVFAEALVAALNQNMMSFELSPAATALEKNIIRWMCGLFGLGGRAFGFLTSGGTAANLNAVVAARNTAWKKWDRNVRLSLFAAESAHYSIAKAADVAGIDPDRVYFVRCDLKGRMDVSCLEDFIRESMAKGEHPFIVCASAGTTTAGAIDPLEDIGAVCRRHEIWFHCDAAHGGALALVPDKRGLIVGIESADSITFDPHKWMYLPKGTGAVLFSDFSLIKENLRYRAPYVERGSVFNFGEFGIQGTRRFDALKLWIVLQVVGIRGIAEIIEHDIKNARILSEMLVKRNNFELVLGPSLNIVCFRYLPAGISAYQADKLQERLQLLMFSRGRAFVSLSSLFDKKVLRAVLMNPRTSVQDMEFMLNEVEYCGSEVLKQLR